MSRKLTSRCRKCCDRTRFHHLGGPAITTIGTRLLVALVSIALLSPGLAAAEPYVAAYLGTARTEDTDLRTEIELNDVPFVNGRARDLSFDSSLLYGGKAGYFFERDLLGGNIGAELDVYHFEPNFGAQRVDFSGTFAGVSGDTRIRLQSANIDVTAVTLNLLYRFRLLSEPRYPRGRLQPYVGIGGGAFIGEIETRTSTFDVNKRISDTDVRPGIQALGGARFFLTRNIALFAEYKFVKTETFSFTFKESGTVSGFPIRETARDRADLTSHLFYGGVGLHW